MAVGRFDFPQVHPVAGVTLGTASAGIKHTTRDDLVVMELAPGSACAAVFTQNAFCAAPVILARRHLAHAPRWLLINSGNANAGTGVTGITDATRLCRVLAEAVGGRPEQVLPFSTGVIGEPLPVGKIEAVLPVALDKLSADGWASAARAIMTTDTRAKGVSRAFSIGKRRVTLTGIAKGAGMIHPQMATMLAFVASDVTITPDALRACLARAVDRSFNCITVDGDTSTNDACVLIATGRDGAPPLAVDSAEYAGFEKAVVEVCSDLAEQIVRDGEGATKLIRICVEGAADKEEARGVAEAIAHSPLVKTAFFAADPNWGRILAAVGRAGCQQLEIGKVSLWIDDVCIVENGACAPAYTEAAGKAVMGGDEIMVRVLLGRGRAVQRMITCDLSYDYVRINAEYRT